VVQADRIEGTIGGDLVISSQQDSSTYTSDSKSAGVSIGIPLPGGTASLSVNASQAQADANFQAVQEQTGLFAGEEGFDLTVQGTTTLNAGAIDSTADSSKNQLITDDLEISTLDNTSEFDIQSQSLSLSTSGGNSAGQADEAGSQSNTTQAVLADGNIQINQKPDFDPEKTQGLTQDANDNQALQNNFSEEQVQIAQESVQASQILGNVAPKIVGDIAQTKVDEAAQLALEADQETDPIKSQQLKQQAQKLLTHWGEGGDLRVALHTLTGLANGDLTGAAASFATAKTIPEIAKALDEAGYEGAEKDTILLAISAAIGSVADGAQGAINTVGQTANNYLKHQERKRLTQLAADLENCEESCSTEQLSEINEEITGLIQLNDRRDLEFDDAYVRCLSNNDCEDFNYLHVTQRQEWNQEAYNNFLTSPKNEDGEPLTWTKLPDSKNEFHNFNSEGTEIINPFPNEKWIGPNGQQEVILNKENGKLVTQPNNAGSYNYYPPSNFFGHKDYDIDPWADLGNEPDDTTTEDIRKKYGPIFGEK